MAEFDVRRPLGAKKRMPTAAFAADFSTGTSR
jgi:hypothetical protein